jgi:methionyl-tRNA formyltransferase
MDDRDLSRIIYHALAAEFSIEAVIREQRIPRTAFLKKRLKKLGWRTLSGQILFTKCIVPLLQQETAQRRAELLQHYGMNDSPIRRDCVIDVPSVNDDQTIALLQKLASPIMVVNGTGILSERILAATDGVFLNIHVGITPLYRGVHGGYWALASHDPEHFGATIHKIDAGIDTGEIIAQAFIQPSKIDNFSTYPLLQIAAAIPLLKQAIWDANNGSLKSIPAPAGKSKLWSHPTAFQYLSHRVRHGIR